MQNFITFSQERLVFASLKAGATDCKYQVLLYFQYYALLLRAIYFSVNEGSLSFFIEECKSLPGVSADHWKETGSLEQAVYSVCIHENTGMKERRRAVKRPIRASAMHIFCVRRFNLPSDQ